MLLLGLSVLGWYLLMLLWGLLLGTAQQTCEVLLGSNWWLNTICWLCGWLSLESRNELLESIWIHGREELGNVGNSGELLQGRSGEIGHWVCSGWWRSWHGRRTVTVGRGYSWSVGLLTSHDKFGGDGRIEVVVFYKRLVPDKKGAREALTIIGCLALTTAIKDLNGNAIALLRLMVEEHNGHHAFNNLTFHDRGQLQPWTEKEHVRS